MEMNVWKIGRCRLRYYLMHPLKWLGDLRLSIKWARQRCKKGYADIDWYNLYDWMIEVFSNMFEEYAKNHYGYPGEEAGFTSEQWTEYLHAISVHMKNASDDQEVQKNEYEDSWEKMSDERWSKLKKWKDDNGFIHHEWPPMTEEQEAIRDRYFTREKEITDWQLSEAQTALRMIGEQFFQLWD